PTTEENIGLQNTCGFNAQLSRGTGRIGVMRFGVESAIDKIEEISGSREFTYTTAVTAIKGEKSVWENHADFSKILNGNPVRVLTFSDILNDLWPTINTTPASSEVGRVLQLIKAAHWLDEKE
ncbi:MAG: hypothetical protein AB2807_09010, partial [Candidatus Sedimenticola endophacoides]